MLLKILPSSTHCLILKPHRHFKYLLQQSSTYSTKVCSSLLLLHNKLPHNQWLKITPIISQSCDQESRYNLTGSFAQGLPGPNSWYQPRLQSHLRLKVLFKTHWLLAKFNSFQLQAQNPHFLAGYQPGSTLKSQRPPSGPCHMAPFSHNMAVCFLRQQNICCCFLTHLVTHLIMPDLRRIISLLINSKSNGQCCKTGKLHVKE